MAATSVKCSMSMPIVLHLFDEKEMIDITDVRSEKHC